MKKRKTFLQGFREDLGPIDTALARKTVAAGDFMKGVELDDLLIHGLPKRTINTRERHVLGGPKRREPEFAAPLITKFKATQARFGDQRFLPNPSMPPGSLYALRSKDNRVIPTPSASKEAVRVLSGIGDTPLTRNEHR